MSFDAQAFNLAIPKLTVALHPSATELRWIVDSYVFFGAGSLITMGVLGDRVGRRRMLFIGGTVFALASLGAAYSPSPGALIAARMIMGVAGSALMPSTLSLIRVMFARQRQRTIAHDDPMVDLGLFRRTAFSVALASNTLSFFVLYGSQLWIAQYLQVVLGLSPLRAGLYTIPSVLGYLAGAAIAPMAAKRLSPHRAIGVGLVIVCIGFALMAGVAGATGWPWSSPARWSSRSAWPRCTR